MELGRLGSGIISAHSIIGWWNSARRTAKEALRPRTMLSYGRDTPKPKRKRNYEPKAATARRLADDSRSTWTLAECERMTREQLTNRLRDLGLKQRLSLEVSTEASSAGQSWEELIAAKVASDEKKAAAAASDSCKPSTPFILCYYSQ